MEAGVRKWLERQLLAPAPNRPRNVQLSDGTTCHINPCANNVKGVEYIDLDVRDKQGGRVIMTIRISADRGTYIETLWR